MTTMDWSVRTCEGCGRRVYLPPEIEDDGTPEGAYEADLSRLCDRCAADANGGESWDDDPWDD